MAPEFFPFIAFLGLAVIAITGFVVGVVRFVLNRGNRAFLQSPRHSS
jgi:hypothetical protein